MIKTCPTCKRTYSDETISFCLADGALLSAPYDQSGPPTEVLPASLVPTQAAVQPTAMPTITAPPPKPPRVTRADSAAPASGGIKRLVLAAAVIMVLAMLSMVGYQILTRQLGQKETTASAVNANSVNVLTSPDDSPRETAKLSTSPSTSLTTASKEREKATPSPLSKVPEKPSVPTPTPVAADTPKTQPVDYNKAFSGKEVTQKARILSQPRAGYTDTARQNGISGTVTLRMVLAASGEVTNITVVSGLPDGLSEKAIAAARQIKFEPAMKDGRAVSQYIQVQYNFSIY
jgi:TonB family protein